MHMTQYWEKVHHTRLDKGLTGRERSERAAQEMESSISSIKNLSQKKAFFIFLSTWR